MGKHANTNLHATKLHATSLNFKYQLKKEQTEN